MPNPEQIKAKIAEIEETIQALSHATGDVAQEMRDEAIRRKHELESQLLPAAETTGAHPGQDPEILTCERMAFCHIPRGTFLFGQGKLKKIALEEYWIGRYPVTNAQFNQFTDSYGYEHAQYWETPQEKGLWTKDGFKGRWDNASRSLAIDGIAIAMTDKPRTSPVDFGEPFSRPDHPVIGVTWYEACAFTGWLNENVERWAQQGRAGSEAIDKMWTGLRSGTLRYSLPSEEEWEKAARGAQGRAYPWGGEFDAGKANTTETGIRATSPVGSFPDGRSPYGLLDASGNVWEWTATSLGGTYVLCGGSFYYTADKAKCSARRWEEPDYWLWDTGFRVVVSSPRP